MDASCSLWPSVSFIYSYSALYHLLIELWPHVIGERQAGKFVMSLSLATAKDTFMIANEAKNFKE